MVKREQRSENHNTHTSRVNSAQNSCSPDKIATAPCKMLPFTVNDVQKSRSCPVRISQLLQL
jgi:hypothetical protein